METLRKLQVIKTIFVALQRLTLQTIFRPRQLLPIKDSHQVITIHCWLVLHMSDTIPIFSFAIRQLKCGSTNMSWQGSKSGGCALHISSRGHTQFFLLFERLLNPWPWMVHSESQGHNWLMDYCCGWPAVSANCYPPVDVSEVGPD